MSDTVWADVSEHQGRPVDLTYPHRFFAYRCSDGTYRDQLFPANDAAAGMMLRRGQLVGRIIYFVWRANWQTSVATVQNQLGERHRPRTAIMIDVESWGGQIGGDHSVGINAARERLIGWLFGLRPAWQRRPIFRAYYRSRDRRRVIGYGNAGDLHTIWPTRGDARVVLAAYGSNPTHPAHIAHQYTSDGTCPPWGRPVDMNSADGRTPRQLARQLGMGGLRWTLR